MLEAENASIPIHQSTNFHDWLQCTESHPDATQLQHVDWSMLVRKLLVFANRKVQRVRRRFSFTLGELLHGMGADDLVQDAITQYLQGKRCWNQQHYNDLFAFMCSVVDSTLYNHVRKQHKLYEVQKELVDLSALSSHRSSHEDPERQVENQEMLQQLQVFVRHLKCLQGDNCLEVKIMEIRLAERDMIPPMELAERLHSKVPLIKAATRRLKYHLEQYMCDQKAGATAR